MDSGHRNLRPFGSSRSEDSFIQVGVDGTGASLPPVDEQVISMKLFSHAKGTIELSREKDPDLFYLACCGLGWPRFHRGSYSSKCRKTKTSACGRYTHFKCR